MKRYMHIERLGTDPTEGILDGLVYIFPKLDGANASIWEGGLASRNRELKPENEDSLRGFVKHINDNPKYQKLTETFNSLIFYGEWLVKHTLNTYRDDAWNKFYIIDVYDTKTQRYVPFGFYSDILDKMDIDYIPPLAVINKPTESQVRSYLDKNSYLIEDGKGIGEGIVVKNYDFFNKYGRQIWAKVVRNEFRDNHAKVMGNGTLQGATSTEDRIVNEYVTKEFVMKEYEKIKTNRNGWESKYIPELLGRIWHEFINEEMWNAVKKYKNPPINFKLLNRLTVNKVKEYLPNVF